MIQTKGNGQFRLNGTFTTHELAALIRENIASYFSKHTEKDSWTSPDFVASFLLTQYAGLEREVFSVAYLDTRHRLINFDLEAFKGTINGASVHPREVVKDALKYNAAAVIFSHNHPSGIPEPSQADIALTRRMSDALRLVDVTVLDHIVVGGASFSSFTQRGLI
jgi:DNA repair protein RadC